MKGEYKYEKDFVFDLHLLNVVVVIYESHTAIKKIKKGKGDIYG